MPLSCGKTLIFYLTYANVFLFVFRGVPVKVLQAAKEHLEKQEKEKNLGWWRRIRSRYVFTSTSPDTSPPTEELIDISALSKWSPQVRVVI